MVSQQANPIKQILAAGQRICFLIVDELSEDHPKLAWSILEIYLYPVSVEESGEREEREREGGTQKICNSMSLRMI